MPTNYSLRSRNSSKQDRQVPDKARRNEISSSEPPVKKSRPSACRRKVIKRNARSKTSTSTTTIYDLPPDVILHIAKFLDGRSLLALFRTCQWFHGMLEDFDPFWKILCIKEDFINYESILKDDGVQEKIGWSGKNLRCTLPDVQDWRKVYLKGIQMRRNIIGNNFEGWRVYANTSIPIVKLTPQEDVLKVLEKMDNLTKMSANDDIKIDWDEKHLVVFHFFRSLNENCVIWVYNIEKEPFFMYSVEKAIEYTTDRVVVNKDHVVIIPSWPLLAQGVVKTLSIKDNMKVVGKFIFDNEDRRNDLDNHWMHTVLRVVKDKALVVCRVPHWECLIIDLPSCKLLSSISLPEVSTDFDCQQVWSYMNMAIILFYNNKQDTSNILVTVDVSASTSRPRSVYNCNNIVDVALFTEPEEVYLVKRNGNVVLYDPTNKVETVKIENKIQARSFEPQTHSVNQHAISDGEYQLFVNRREEICVMQSSADVKCGRYIKVYDYDTCVERFTINLDLWKYGMSRDESVCIYTNQAFLAVANSKKLLLFNVKTGQHLGALTIPSHLERALGKDDSSCTYEPTGLNLFIFDEDKLIAVHDYERSYPAVLDIYRFW